MSPIKSNTFQYWILKKILYLYDQQCREIDRFVFALVTCEDMYYNNVNSTINKIYLKYCIFIKIKFLLGLETVMILCEIANLSILH